MRIVRGLLALVTVFCAVITLSGQPTGVRVAVQPGTPPVISNLSVSTGQYGTAVTVTGTGFGAQQGSSFVRFNGVAAATSSWADTSIGVTVPVNSTTGSVVVIVGGAPSNAITFTIPSPTLTGLSVSSGVAGDPVTLTGTNFGTTQGLSRVTFNGTVATAASWSSTSVVVSVPSGATSGNVVVTVGGVASNGSAFSVTGSAVVTVNWLDPLGYAKPVGLAVTMPSEAAAVNKYWVNLSGGSGTTCSMAAPCDWPGLSGKAGTVGAGGGAYVYVKGTNDIGGTGSNIALRGTAGNEIVFKPWPAGSTGCATECIGTIDGDNVWSNAHQYLIFDGGPDMKIRFNNTGSDQFRPIVAFSGTGTNNHHITFYRTRWHVGGTGEWLQHYGSSDNLAFINSEFDALGATDTTNQHHLYISGCTGNQPITNLTIKNNIFRDSPGEVIEFRQAGADFDNITITGNVFHDVGKGTCAGSWKCREAIDIVDDSGGCTGGGSWGPNLIFANNVMWDCGAGCIRAWGTLATHQFYNNTVAFWGMGSPPNQSWGSAAVSGTINFNQAPAGDWQNNIFYATGNDFNGNPKVPYNSNITKGSTQACIATGNCGTSKQTIAAACFLSLDENNIDFLKLTAACAAVDHAASLAAVVLDFLGVTRPQGTLYDIGAFER